MSARRRSTDAQQPREPAQQIRGPKHGVRVAVWVAVSVVVLAAVFVGVARATDASAFCRSCHEMGPYYDAWAAGQHGHEGVPCIDCHVNRGFLPRLSHKFVALGEVWSHFFGNTTFPMASPPSMPNSRCLGCHAQVATKPQELLARSSRVKRQLP